MSRRFSLFPKTLKECVNSMAKPIFKKHGFAETKIITDWQLIIGPELAPYCLPKKLTFPPQHRADGVLHMVVHAPRALEIQHMQGVMLERINLYMGYPAVKRIVMEQAYLPVTLPQKPVTARKATADPAINATLETIEDAELKSALSGLGSALSQKH